MFIVNTQTYMFAVIELSKEKQKLKYAEAKYLDKLLVTLLVPNILNTSVYELL